jgi:uncharacterized protein
MILPDVNLLLYAYDKRAKFHLPAKKWWKDCLEREEVGLPLLIVFGFIRIATSPRVYEEPLDVEEAIRHATTWMEQPGVRVIEAGYPKRTFELLMDIGTGGNLVSDAQLAAITIEEQAVLHTADTDFRRFKGLKTFYPLGN